MTLLEDLQSIDLSGIIAARGSISVSVQNPEIQALLQGGAVQTALGSLGTSLQTVRDSFDDPAALIQPLMDALGELAAPLNTADLPLDDYLQAVRAGGEILARLFADFDGDPASLGRIAGRSLGEMLDQAEAAFSQYTHVDLGDLAEFRSVIDLVEGGVPTSPDAFADLAVQVLLPFSRTDLTTIRNRLDALLNQARTISLPRTRTAQLASALEAVALAADAGDTAAVQGALHELDQVRLNTQTAIQNDLLRAAALIDGLHIGQALGVIVSASGALRTAEDGILEFMEKVRAELAAVRQQLDIVDPAIIKPFIQMMLDAAEHEARVHIADVVDASVLRLEEWLRNLLRHLPLRELRAELTGYIQAAAQAIIDADLDQYARVVYGLLDDLKATIESANLGDEVRAALESAEQAVTNVLDGVFSALETIGNEINAVADEARDVLERVVEALASFQASIQGVQDAVDNLGIEAATQEVINTLTTLRETAEELLSVAPLPEPMRPLVEQLIETLRGVNVDVIFEPVRAAVSEFEIPDEVSGTITEGLQAAADALDNLIPAELINSIQAEIDAVLNEIRAFDPSSLLSGVTGFINETADFIEGLDPRPQIASIRGPYLELLNVLDSVHPARLLAPVIEAYDSLLGEIPVPAPQDGARRISQAVGAVGENVARAAVEPVRQLAPPGAVSLTGTGETAEPPSLEGARPGDVVRMFGYLPNKLREALRDLDTGPAGEVLRTLDSLCGGLAQNLRRAQAVLWEIDQRLVDDLDALFIPLGQAQLRAQLSIQARFSAGGASFDVNGALEAVALAGPGAMRVAAGNSIEAARRQARHTAISAGGTVGASLERAAFALERCRLSSLGGDLDAFLAALDPEPVAAEVDALLAAVLAKMPTVIAEIEDDLRMVIERGTRLMEIYNPGAQAQKFLKVIDVLREELDLLNPARLAAELGEIHAAIRETIEAYDPALLAEAIAEVTAAVATSLRALDPAALLGDLTFLDDIVDRVEAASPLNALQGVGASLDAVGEQMIALDPAGLLDSVQDLGVRLLDSIQRAIEAIKQEIIALLESIQYISGVSASASVSVEVG